MKSKNFDLEDRLIAFAILILDLSEGLPNTYAGKHLEKQLIRSGTSPALNYGEAQASESRKDFIHKIKVCLKELRESFICMKILKKKYPDNQSQLEVAISECNELIAIFNASVQTAKSRL